MPLVHVVVRLAHGYDFRRLVIREMVNLRGARGYWVPTDDERQVLNERLSDLLVITAPLVIGDLLASLSGFPASLAVACWSSFPVFWI